MDRIRQALVLLRRKILEKTIGPYVRRIADEYATQKVETYIRAKNFIENYLKDAIPCLERSQLHDFALSIVNKDLMWWAEFGVYKGTTLKYFASKAPKNIMIYGFDSFEGLPEDWDKFHKKGYFKTKMPKLNLPNVTLVKGWFNESLPKFLSEHQLGQVGFIHMDVDLHYSTKTVLDLLTPHISSGTVIVFDEFYNHPRFEEHEFKALNEWAKENEISYEYKAYCLTMHQVCVQIV